MNKSLNFKNTEHLESITLLVDKYINLIKKNKIAKHKKDKHKKKKEKRKKKNN